MALPPMPHLSSATTGKPSGWRARGFVSARISSVLTAAAGMAGEVDLASATLQELRRAQPNVSLAWVASQLPLKLEQERDHFLEGLRRAGLN